MGPPCRRERRGGRAERAERDSWAGWTGLRGEQLGREKKKEKGGAGPDGLETKRVRGKSFPFFSKRKTNTFKFKFEHKDSNSN